MSIPEISKMFGMKTKDFCNFLGYTRQGIYKSLRNEKSHICRWVASINSLERYSEDKYLEEIDEAKFRREKRIEICNELRNIKNIFSPLKFDPQRTLTLKRKLTLKTNKNATQVKFTALWTIIGGLEWRG